MAVEDYAPASFTLHNGLLFYKGRIFLSHSSPLKPLVLQHVHNSPCGGHFGYLKTLHRVRHDFFWKGMVKDVKLHVHCCEVCQRVKVSTSNPAGLLQPLSVPNKPWLDISMDFIEGLPKSHGYEVIFVVVDKLTKFVHFIPLSHPYTAVKVAAIFMKNVFKLHGMPKTIVSDRGSIFTAHFWQELFKLQGIELAMSSAYHPQSDGQTKVVNRSLEQYLRAFVGDKPSAWADWLHLAEYWFNTNFHTSTKLALFEAFYGIPPSSLLDYIPGATQVTAMDQLL